MTQCIVQTMLILYGQRVVLHNPAVENEKPGRQAITFLLVVNITLWLLNTFEMQGTTSNALLLDYYGDDTWAMIVHSTVPLTILYRFHSSVCLAEIWKQAYKTRLHGSASTLSINTIT